ncbi:hypothetical protein C7974DRAFT_405526 [Boeremia exigua]|uniref:uncharacterized protein n=1 Tax=Boeremia exigua TaxID=749465 RepID=UPI001E8DE894|nr:uncharacterized protein C7974DRAFT_405526 [Boeremia exigua]KAH6612422.1 hypothetical protein C7974DRAFT_405526 [Boeremia exigua]
MQDKHPSQMAQLPSFLSASFIFLYLIICLTAADPGSHSSIHTQKIYQFPNGTWVENIAVRRNGNLLVTHVNAPQLWEIHDPSLSLRQNPQENTTASLIHTFGSAEFLTGITEMEPDVFIVGSPKTLWRVDYRRATRGGRPSITKITTVLGALNMNGMTTLDVAKGLVLTADSMLGVIWRVNVRTGESSIVLEDERTMTADTSLGPLVGVNGVKIHEDYVYYNNAPQRLYCRVKINRNTGTAVGPYELISDDTMADDFVLDRSGVGYLAGLIDNVVTLVHPNGTHRVIAGAQNSTEFAMATAAAFGRTRLDHKVLYVTTGGALGTPVTETGFEGGKIVAIKL